MDRDRQVLKWLYEGGYYGVVGAVLLAGFSGIALLAGFPVPLRDHPAILLLTAAVAGFLAGRGMGKMLFKGSGRAAQSIYMPGAAGSYAHTHSEIDTLEAKGDFQGAADAWDAVAIAEPGNAWALIRAGELYMRSLANPTTALDRFRVARHIQGISVEHHVYATQKIVDLYLGPLNDHGRALVELSRLAQQRPGTREAAFAREAIARIKSERPTES